jgi:hypothetical protein
MRKGTQRSSTVAGSTGQSSVATRSGFSRRRLLVGAGALGVATAALPLLRATPAMASNTGRAFFGSTQGVYWQIKNAVDANGSPIDIAIPVPNLNGVRIYDTQPTGNKTVVPTKSWPKGPTLVETIKGGTITTPYSGPIVFSIYPNPAEVADSTSQTYANLQTLIGNAPPNSYLAAWHEGLYLPHPDYITVASLLALHTALYKMCLKLNPTNVTYGAILATTETWDAVPDTLGFYGLDIYAPFGAGDGSGEDAIANEINNVLDPWIRNAENHYTSDPKSVWPGTAPNYPNVIICETNMPPDPNTGSTEYRGQWFEAVCTRMHTYGSDNIGVLTFWRDDGSLSGPWLPGDKPTEQAMNYITDSIF